MWSIKVIFDGDEPSEESEVEAIEDKVQAALDAAGIDYLDLSVG